MNKVRRLLIRLKIVKGKPHEKAELGQGTWGRQPGSSGAPVITASSKPKATIKMRVWREATQTWEEK